MTSADDYWEQDELDDRIFYAQQHKARQQRHKASGSGLRLPLALTRSRRAPSLLAIVVFLLLWWYIGSSFQLGVFGKSKSWDRVAYSQYATDTQSLCNSLLIFESLQRLGSKPDRVLLYPQEWDVDRDDINDRLMRKAARDYGVKLVPIELISADLAEKEVPGTLDDPSDWDTSVTKLRVFELVQYDRVLHLDSDVVLLKHMDELFDLPRAPIAMPRAYWSDGPASSWQLTSLIMLVEPNPLELTAMIDSLRAWQAKPENIGSKKYDMDILNHRFAGSALVLPHRPYAMLSAEYRSRDHSAYLGTINAHQDDARATWDAERAFKEAKLVHFSDWPLPKPWIMWPTEGLAEVQPDCGGPLKPDCKERQIWKGLYEDFRRKRRDICKILSVPAPDWQQWKKDVTPS